MKVHWFSVLSVAGIILLTGNSFGNGVQWKTPDNGKSVAPSVTHIPAVITTGDARLPAVLQVQHAEPPFQSLPLVPRAVSTPVDVPDYSYNPPPGASLQPLPGTPVQAIPITPPTLSPRAPTRTGEVVPCRDQIAFKSIREISHDIRPAHTGELPQECFIESNPFYGRHFSQTCFQWKASALATKGAYFEDTQLERYGHTKVEPVLQPFVSGAKFFGNVVILPYRMGVHPPNECVYTLGHHRPGSCAPYMVEPFPISPRGALFQAGAVTGVLFAVP